MDTTEHGVGTAMHVAMLFVLVRTMNRHRKFAPAILGGSLVGAGLATLIFWLFVW
jgi:hypothetical protein